MPIREPSRAFAAIVVLIGVGAVAPDAARGAERALSLDQAIALSLSAPAVLAAREAVNQARAEQTTASLLPNPGLGVELSMLPLSRPYSVEEPGGPPELAAELRYQVDGLLFGKRSAAMASARAGVRTAEAEFQDTLRQRTAQTSTTFHDVLEAQALLQAASQARSDLEQTEAAIGKAVANGGRPQVELSRVRLELQAAKREERGARAALGSAQASLQALLGLVEPVRLVGTLDGPLLVKPLGLDSAFEVAAENRPDLAALRHKLSKAHEDRVAEGRKAWPETVVGLGVSHQFQHAVGAPDVTAYGVSLEMGLPLFDRNQGERAKAAATARQADHELTDALSRIRAEVEQAAQALDAAREDAAEMTRTDLDLASQVRDSFRKAYESGGRPLLEMLDAQRSYHETYRAYVSTRAEYWRAVARYEAALGKKVSP